MTNYRIGIPRGLMYYYYYPAWEEFFRGLGLEIVVSPPTNRGLLERGVSRSVDDLCLPFKAYFGHVDELKDMVDYLFIPRFFKLGDNNSVCPKFMGLPDMVRAVFAGEGLPPLLDPVVDLKKGLFSLRRLAHQLGKRLNRGYWQVERAFWKGLYRLQASREKRWQSQDSYQPGKSPDQSPQQLTVAVLGHLYLIRDECLSLGLIRELQERGVRVITHEDLAPEILEQAACRQPKPSFWYYNRQLMGAAYHLLAGRGDSTEGIIQLNAFGCGPDSLISELIELKGKRDKRIAMMNVNVDEHSGQAGLITRLEAFIDLLERRKNK
ncbi:MAG: acyl-CoA dehydratase activase-related protein [Bacillota bacterium]